MRMLKRFFILFSSSPTNDSKICILWRSVYNQNASDKQRSSRVRKKCRDSQPPTFIRLQFYVRKSLNDGIFRTITFNILRFFSLIAYCCNFHDEAVCICDPLSLLKVAASAWEKFGSQRKVIIFKCGKVFHLDTQQHPFECEQNKTQFVKDAWAFCPASPSSLTAHKFLHELS